MSPTLEEVSKIKQRISEIMEDVAKEQQELEEIILFIDNMKQADLHLMLERASTARSKRSKAQVRSAEEEKQDYERRRNKKQESLECMWMKIHDLQEQEERLKETVRDTTRDYV